MSNDLRGALEGRDFIRDIVAADLESGKHGGRVATRFPPEPNGFLHIGHAKAICLNFGVSEESGGICNLRFDDTNPTKEDISYVEAMKKDIRWLGFEWDGLFHASDYFEQLFSYAVVLIEKGVAYVDSLTETEIPEYRGTVTEPGRNSPYRDRSVEDNLDLFRRMRAGEFQDGEHVLRAKIDMAANNMIMRDPILYRIRHAHHYRTGDEWSIYPMYDFAHCLSDSIERITHSLCSLEFTNNREIYDWLLEEVGAPQPVPRQYEFARLNLDYTITSKRKLLRLVSEGKVAGWDDPRMPTLSGLRRRGVTPEAIRTFCDLIGVAKADNRVDVGKLEYVMRDDLNMRVPRVMCVLRPLKVVITNYPEGDTNWLDASLYPRDVPLEGSRRIPFSRELYIEREDFAESPPPGFHRLAPGREVRLRYGYFVKCEAVVKNDQDEIVEIHCTYDPDTEGGSAPDGRKVKGTLHWVSAEHSLPCDVRLYDRLFIEPDPNDAPEGEDFIANLNADSLVVLNGARIEPSVADDPAGSRYQFERQGYFVSDTEDSAPGRLVYNRTVTLRDSWARIREAREAASASASVGSGDGSRKRSRKSTASTTASAPTRRRRELPPELAQKLAYYRDTLGLAETEAGILAGDAIVASFFDDARSVHDDPKAVASWVVNHVLREAKGRPLTDLAVTGQQLGSLLALARSRDLPGTVVREAFARMAREGGDPAEIIERYGLDEVSDPTALAPIVDRLLGEYPDKVDAYRGGRTGLFGFFVGQVMREAGGLADPKLVKELLAERLD